MAFEFLRRFRRGEMPAGEEIGEELSGTREGYGEGDSYVTATVVPVGGLFSESYGFHLPWFQRAYAWREEHVGRLLADMIEAMGSPKRRYFLGAIRIAGGHEPGAISLIDGQQRMVTLTILFALLRDLAQTEEDKDAADQAIRGSVAGKVNGSSDWFWMVPQLSLKSFFVKYVQARGGRAG